MNYLIHYGTPRHSGRYPYGSGENPYQGLKGSRKSLVRDAKLAQQLEKGAKNNYERATKKLNAKTGIPNEYKQKELKRVATTRAEYEKWSKIKNSKIKDIDDLIQYKRSIYPNKNIKDLKMKDGRITEWAGIGRELFFVGAIPTAYNITRMSNEYNSNPDYYRSRR